MSRSKVIILILLAVISVTGLNYYQTSRETSHVFINLQKENARKALKLLQASANAELRVRRLELSGLAKIEGALKNAQRPKNREALSADLIASGLQGLVLVKKQGDTVVPEWMSFKETVLKNWSEYLISKIYSTVDYSLVKPGTFFFEKILNHQKHPVWLGVMSVQYENFLGIDGLPQSQEGYLIGVYSAQAMSELGLAMRGFEYEYFLVTDQGYAVSHSVTGYISASFAEHPVLVSQVGEEPLQEKAYEQDGQSYVGFKEKVPYSNLTLAVTKELHPYNLAPYFFNTQWLIALGALATLLVGLCLVMRNAALEQLSLTKTLIKNAANGIFEIQPVWTQKVPDMVAAVITLEQKIKKTATSTGEMPHKASEPMGQANNKSVLEPSDLDESLKNDHPLGHNTETMISPLGKNKQPEFTNSYVADLSSNELGDSEPLDEVQQAAQESKSEQQQLSPPEGFYSAIDQIKQTLFLLKNRMKSENIELVFSEKVDGDVFSPGEGAEFSRAFKNLLLNAIEAVEKSDQKKVAISVVQHQDELHVSLEDSGPGIKEEQIEEIFEPFYSTKDSAKHPGMGLAVAQKALLELGGYMDVGEAAGPKVLGGAHFKLVVPLGEQAVAATPGHRIEISDEDVDDDLMGFELATPTKLGGLSPLDPNAQVDLPAVPDKKQQLIADDSHTIKGKVTAEDLTQTLSAGVTKSEENERLENVKSDSDDEFTDFVVSIRKPMVK